MRVIYQAESTYERNLRRLNAENMVNQRSRVLLTVRNEATNERVNRCRLAIRTISVARNVRTTVTPYRLGSMNLPPINDVQDLFTPDGYNG